MRSCVRAHHKAPAATGVAVLHSGQSCRLLRRGRIAAHVSDEILWNVGAVRHESLRRVVILKPKSQTEVATRHTTSESAETRGMERCKGPLAGLQPFGGGDARLAIVHVPQLPLPEPLALSRVAACVCPHRQGGPSSPSARTGAISPRDRRPKQVAPGCLNPGSNKRPECGEQENERRAVVSLIGQRSLTELEDGVREEGLAPEPLRQPLDEVNVAVAEPHRVEPFDPERLIQPVEPRRARRARRRLDPHPAVEAGLLPLFLARVAERVDHHLVVHAGQEAHGGVAGAKEDEPGVEHEGRHRFRPLLQRGTRGRKEAPPPALRREGRQAAAATAVHSTAGLAAASSRGGFRRLGAGGLVRQGLMRQRESSRGSAAGRRTRQRNAHLAAEGVRSDEKVGFLPCRKVRQRVPKPNDVNVGVERVHAVLDQAERQEEFKLAHALERGRVPGGALSERCYCVRASQGKIRDGEGLLLQRTSCSAAGGVARQSETARLGRALLETHQP